MLIRLTLLLTLVMAVTSVQAQVELQYSGADWDAGGTTGTMTISALDGATTLWTLDLYQVAGNGVTFSKFTDGGAFNYAAGQESYWGYGLLQVGWGGYQNQGDFTQVTKTADQYVFTLSKDVTADFHQDLTYTINKPGANGTAIEVAYVLTHIGVDPVEAYGGFDVRGVYNIGAAGEAMDYVTGYELAVGSPDVHVDRVHQRISDQEPGLWSVTENVDYGAGSLITDDYGGWTATVLDNSTASGLGMTAGLSFAVTTDAYAYYPAPSVGDAAVVDGSVTYNDHLLVEFTPREWQDGPARPSPYPTMSNGETYTTNAVLTVNIAAAGGPDCSQPGDADGDGDVDLDDFVVLKTNWGGPGGDCSSGDFEGDGDVDLDDFVILKNNWGAGAVPEPASMSLLALAAAAGLTKKRRR